MTADTSGRCPVCLAAEAGGNERSLVVERGDRYLTMLNAYPYAAGHLMVLPCRHIGELQSMDTAEQSEVMSLTQRAVRALTAVMSPDGFNVGLNLGSAAGAGWPSIFISTWYPGGRATRPSCR